MRHRDCINTTLANVTSSNSSLCDIMMADHDNIITGDDDAEHTIVLSMQEPPLIQTNFSMAVIYVILMVSALSVGSVGNLLILIASVIFKGLRKHGFIFVMNLAAADLCVAGIADPMCVIAVLKGEAWFNDKPWLCETVAAMCLTACFCAFLSLTLASLNRYVFVCHNFLYNRLFTKKMCIIMCISAWLMAFTFEFPNFVGWGDHSFDKKSHQCIWDRTASLSYTVIVSVCLIGMPLFTMAGCYILIFQKIYSTKVNLYKIDSDNPDHMKKVWSETMKSSRMLFVIFIIFVLLWTPYAVVIAADVKNTMPVSLHLFVTMLAHLHSSVNFCVYMVCNRNFRICVLRLFRYGGWKETSSFMTQARTSSTQKSCSVAETISSSLAATSAKSNVIG